MKNLLDLKSQEGLIARLANLNPSSRPAWGKMNVHQVLPHMTDPLQCATGKRPVPPMNSMFSKPVFREFVVWVMPWPKGAPTSPDFLPDQGGTTPIDFDRDKQALLLAIHQFVHHGASHHFAPSPVFGPISNRSWGRLMWRHIDHHLRQFGV